jgi:hypothetical protein
MAAPKAPKQAKPEPASQGEIQDRELGKQINLLNLKQSGYDAVWDPDKQTYSFTETPQSPEQQQQAARNRELEDLAFAKLKGTVSDADRKMVGDTFQAQREAGNQELNRYATEMAGARGLDVTDSPFQRELGIQKQGLETGLRGAEAASLLDVGNRQQIFGQALREFSTGLNQQALMNRMAMGQGATQSALSQMGNRYGIAGRSIGQPGGGGMGAGMGALGGAASGAMMGMSAGPWGAAIGAGLGAIGGAASGSRG